MTIQQMMHFLGNVIGFRQLLKNGLSTRALEVLFSAFSKQLMYWELVGQMKTTLLIFTLRKLLLIQQTQIMWPSLDASSTGTIVLVF